MNSLKYCSSIYKKSAHEISIPSKFAYPICLSPNPLQKNSGIKFTYSLIYFIFCPQLFSTEDEFYWQQHKSGCRGCVDPDELGFSFGSIPSLHLLMENFEKGKKYSRY
jgi:hypothetical protein